MDTRKFAGIARELTTDTTRRHACKVFAAGSLGVALTRLGFGAALAGCKKVTQTCKKTDQCCGKLVCKNANSQNYYDQTVKRCCRKLGQDCNQGIECCGIDVICNGGICQSA